MAVIQNPVPDNRPVPQLMVTGSQSPCLHTAHNYRTSTILLLST